MRSVGTVGLLSLGGIISVLVVIRIFSKDFYRRAKVDKGVIAREFSREVDREDMDRNASDIIENQISKRIISHEVDRLDMHRNASDIIGNQMLKRIISHHVGSLWRSKFRHLDVIDAVYRKEVNLEANLEFIRNNEELIKQERIEQQKLNAEKSKNSASAYYKRRGG